MMDSLKTYLVEVGVKKILPSLIKTGLMALLAYMAAHQNLLSSLGITYGAQDHTIDIDLDVMSTWLLIAVPAGITAIMTAMQHHGTAVIKALPQSGDMRQNNSQSIEGGNRTTDQK